MSSRSRRNFTPEEDKQLCKLVGQFGVRSWPIIASAMSNRTIRQCRDRWRHYLSVPKRGSPWTAEEDAKLVQKVDEFGLKWVQIAQCFTNRGDLDIKRRWFQIYQERYKLLKRNLSRPMKSRRRTASLEVKHEVNEESDQTQNEEMEGIDMADLGELSWLKDTEDTEESCLQLD
jgi:hypothetical protein